MKTYEKYDYNIWSQSNDEICVTAYRLKPLDLFDPRTGAEFTTNTEIYTTKRLPNTPENADAVRYLLKLGLGDELTDQDDLDTDEYDAWVSYEDLLDYRSHAIFRAMVLDLPDYELRETRLVS